MERMTRHEFWGYLELPLTNGVDVEKGELACVDTATGLLTKGAATATLIPLGYFEQNMTGDGTTDARVRLFDDIKVHWWDNDTGGTPVTAADVGSDCHILNDRTVTGAGTGPVAGTVFGVHSSRGVAVRMKGF